MPRHKTKPKRKSNCISKKLKQKKRGKKVHVTLSSSQIEGPSSVSQVFDNQKFRDSIEFLEEINIDILNAIDCFLSENHVSIISFEASNEINLVLKKSSTFLKVSFQTELRRLLNITIKEEKYVLLLLEKDIISLFVKLVSFDEASHKGVLSFIFGLTDEITGLSKEDDIKEAVSSFIHLIDIKINGKRRKKPLKSIEFDVANFFSLLEPQENSKIVKFYSLETFLISKLYSFQAQALSWMISRESNERINLKNFEKLFFCNLDSNDVSYSSYYNLFYSNDIIWSNSIVNGGIFSDEMGLGKTVVTLSLIVENQRNSYSITSNTLNINDNNTQIIPNTVKTDLGHYWNPFTTEFEDKSKSLVRCICCIDSCSSNNTLIDELETIKCTNCLYLQHKLCIPFENINENSYLCFFCRTEKMNLVPIKSTLIVTPFSIQNQWINELNKHIISDKVTYFVYVGIRKASRQLVKLINKYTKTKSSNMKQNLYKKIKHILIHFSVTQLNEFDIIFTSYHCLREEFDHCPLENQRSMRYFKKYIDPKSLLPNIEFWRICLDEAQEIENGFSAAAKMALKLSCVNRWCITGTPIGNGGIEDLRGLLNFLKYEPFDDIYLWNNHNFLETIENTDNIALFMKDIFWRNNKTSAVVKRDLKMNEKSENIHKLKFSSLEEHFYQKQFESIQRQIANLKHKSNYLDASMNLLLRLRQCCCHPQIGTHGIKFVLKKKRKGFFLKGNKKKVKKKIMTIGDVYDSLVQETLYECEESFRLLIMNNNGLAGCYALQNDFKKTMEIYTGIWNEILAKTKDLQFKVDSFQKLHVREGMLNCLNKSEKKNDQTFQLHKEKLKREIDGYRNEFVKVCASALTEKSIEFDEIVKAFEPFSSVVFSKSNSCWWLDTLNMLTEDKANELTSTLKSSTAHGGFIPLKYHHLVKQFKDISGLALLLEKEITTLKELRKGIHSAVLRMRQEPTVKELNEASICQLCRDSLHGTRSYQLDPKNICTNCSYEVLLQSFESKLFSFSLKQKERTEILLQRNWLRMNEEKGEKVSLDFLSNINTKSRKVKRKVNYTSSSKDEIITSDKTSSEVVLIFKAIQKYISYLPEEVKGSLKEVSNNFMKGLDQLVKELYAAREVWRKKDAFLKGLDELAMATTRMTLVPDSIDIPNDEKVWRIHNHEIPSRIYQYQQEIQTCRVEFDHRLSRLRFLSEMNKSIKPESKEEDKSKCQICMEKLSNFPVLMLLECGHSFCEDCLLEVAKRQGSKYLEKRVRCPLCRRQVRYQRALKNKPDVKDQEITDPIEINMSGYGTKIDAIVKTVLKIEEEDDTAKIVIFSQWTEVLDILGYALALNVISFVSYSGNKKHELLESFKKEPRVRCLLIPLKQGNHGLNLTEANHVFMVEPVLNAAIDLQAVSRIDRISQTQAVYVHRFIIEGTVEEKILELMKAKSDSLAGKNEQEKASEEEVAVIFG